VSLVVRKGPQGGGGSFQKRWASRGGTLERRIQNPDAAYLFWKERDYTTLLSARTLTRPLKEGGKGEQAVSEDTGRASII